MPGDVAGAGARRWGRTASCAASGRAGWATVYLAERADGAFEQTVALKLVKRGMDSDAVLRRFRPERQILARLDHPGIARLLDGGRADDGRPYFAMEFVDGEPITDYCDRLGLDVEARLALFRQVCEAVQYAHRQPRRPPRPQAVEHPRRRPRGASSSSTSGSPRCSPETTPASRDRPDGAPASTC